MSAVPPWEVAPALQPSRLTMLAQLVVDTRDRTFAQANRAEGDTNWGLGCRAYERFAHALERLAETSERGWLRVERQGLAFSASIEGVALRIYRGAADRPPMRQVRAAAALRRAEDARQLALFSGGAPASPWLWMMAVETRDDGFARRVVFYEVDELGEMRNHWLAPVSSGGAQQLTLDGAVAPPRTPKSRGASRAAAGKRAESADQRQTAFA
jgi:hypothetical protein